MATSSEVCESPSGSSLENISCAEEKIVEKGSAPQIDAEDTQYPRGLALAMILASVLMAMFLVSLVSIPLYE
jgi:hypothetical protein